MRDRWKLRRLRPGSASGVCCGIGGSLSVNGLALVVGLFADPTGRNRPSRANSTAAALPVGLGVEPCGDRLDTVLPTGSSAGTTPVGPPPTRGHQSRPDDRLQARRPVARGRSRQVFAHGVGHRLAEQVREDLEFAPSPDSNSILPRSTSTTDSRSTTRATAVSSPRTAARCSAAAATVSAPAIAKRAGTPSAGRWPGSRGCSG